MPTLKGKKQLCSCVKKHFKSTQGLGGHSLFDRYKDIENVVNNRIDEKYRHFLAQPEDKDDTIIWFSKSYSETPQRLSELYDEERTQYEQIKNDTIAHFRSVIDSLRNEGKNNEAECLEKATKFINNDFLYCYDNTIVLGIWGLQLKENVRKPYGIAMQNLFSKKKKSQQLPITDDPPPTESEQPEVPIENPFKIRFNKGDGGNLNGNTELLKCKDEIVAESEVPIVEPQAGYEFIGWDRNPINYIVTGDKEFTAQYRPTPPITLLPWYMRFWNWLRGLFFGTGWLKWLLWLLLLLLFILLLSWLFRRYNSGHTAPIPYPINDKPWVYDDPRVGDGGGIYDPGNPYEQIPTPPEYGDVLPPNQGELPPIDTTKIIRDPGNPVIIGNRLNILMENQEKSIMDLARDFKVKYPKDKYKVVYYDDVIKRMQIEVPVEERMKLKSEIPAKFAPEYELFVFDEVLFEGRYIPNDPAFADSNKSWYMKAINAPQAWNITRGSPKLTIAIVDNGFSLKHPELKSKVVMPYNVWLHSKDVFPQQIDHGTHVAGTALAIADNGKGLCGIAPECAFMPVQVANLQGLMTTTSVLDGVLYALYQGADVINVSLGMEFTGTLPENVQHDLQDNHFKEEERLWNEVMKISNKHKAIIVVAAGNENMLAGINPLNRPKNFIIVSAVDKSNREFRKVGFSNYGDYSTVSAPGVGIYSTVGSSSYQTMDGTSMAAPIVSGTVALMKSLNKDLTSEQIICVLQGTGRPAEGKIGNLIQIDKALQEIKSGEFTDCDSHPKTPSTGDVQVLLSWDNYNDLDLICIDPNNEKVWFKNKNVSSGGKLEIDMNVNYPGSKSPIESIYWPSGGAPNGTYSVFLLYYKQHININETPYKIIVKYGDKTEEHSGTIKHEDKPIPICTFTLGSAENRNNPKLPPSDRRRDELLRERESLQRQLDQIDRELQNIRNNVNSNK
jgi:serine protease